MRAGIVSGGSDLAKKYIDGFATRWVFINTPQTLLLIKAALVGLGAKGLLVRLMAKPMTQAPVHSKNVGKSKNVQGKRAPKFHVGGVRLVEKTYPISTSYQNILAIT